MEVEEFYNKKEKFDHYKKLFEKAKNEFYAEMDKQMQDKDELFVDCLSRTLKVKKTQRVTIKFDVDKVSKAIGKDFAKRVINAKYEITDMQGLIKYLKSCGVSAKKFKSFLNVTKWVDEKALDQLEELGYIGNEDLKGCYKTTLGKPYYKVSEVERNDSD